MKNIIFNIALIASMLFSIQTLAICQIAPLDNVKECFSDPSGECCVVVYEQDGRRCAGAFCQEYDQCSWDVLIPIRCVDP